MQRLGSTRMLMRYRGKCAGVAWRHGARCQEPGTSLNAGLPQGSGNGVAGRSCGRDWGCLRAVCVKTIFQLFPTACCVIAKDECMENASADSIKQQACMQKYRECIAGGPGKKRPRPPETTVHGTQKQSLEADCAR